MRRIWNDEEENMKEMKAGETISMQTVAGVLEFCKVNDVSIYKSELTLLLFLFFLLVVSFPFSVIRACKVLKELKEIPQEKNI